MAGPATAYKQNFADCAVTGNVTSLRNKLGVEDLLTKVYHEGPGKWPAGDEAIMPQLPRNEAAER